ncbi:MAG TPA: hypothetical protein DCR97_11565 [Deltaproteobacteria bacterium]|nr:hypothetical protein [Deltaproteobacteria bacterium]
MTKKAKNDRFETGKKRLWINKKYKLSKDKAFCNFMPTKNSTECTLLEPVQPKVTVCLSSLDSKEKRHCIHFAKNGQFENQDLLHYERTPGASPCRCRPRGGALYPFLAASPRLIGE